MSTRRRNYETRLVVPFGRKSTQHVGGGDGDDNDDDCSGGHTEVFGSGDIRQIQLVTDDALICGICKGFHVLVSSSCSRDVGFQKHI